MRDIMDALSAPTKAHHVEARIGMKKDSGFSLLLYKDSRTDVQILNDVCGMNWKNKYHRDEKGNLVCEISILNPETGEWISREDTGTESNTEASKGEYSDALKRAGFRWGICIDLYDAPFIWVNGKAPYSTKDWSIEFPHETLAGGIIVRDGKGNMVYKHLNAPQGDSQRTSAPAPAPATPKPAKSAYDALLDDNDILLAGTVKGTALADVDTKTLEAILTVGKRFDPDHIGRIKAELGMRKFNVPRPNVSSERKAEIKATVAKQKSSPTKKTDPVVAELIDAFEGVEV